MEPTKIALNNLNIVLFLIVLIYYLGRMNNDIRDVESEVRTKKLIFLANQNDRSERIKSSRTRDIFYGGMFRF